MTHFLACPGYGTSLSTVTKRENDAYWPPEKQQLLPSREGPFVKAICLSVLNFLFQARESLLTEDML